MAAIRVLCTVPPHRRQGELASMGFVPAPPHPHPHFMQYFAFYTTRWMNFHGSFHRTIGPVLCHVPLHLRWVLAASAELTPPGAAEYQCFTRGNCVMLQHSRCCGGTAVQMWAYLWVGKGEERKDKILKLFIG